MICPDSSKSRFLFFPNFLVLRIGLPASDSPVDSDDQRATSQWCTSTIQKLASFTVSVLRENTQLRTGTTVPGKVGTPRSQASADEAGGHSVEMKEMKLGIGTHLGPMSHGTPFLWHILPIPFCRDVNIYIYTSKLIFG